MNQSNSTASLQILHERIDTRVGELALLHPQRLRCERGCNACCVDDLTVFSIEAMRSRRVKLGDRVLPLPDPFLVVATTNPADRDGTPLPAAHLDRFMLKVVVPFPSVSEERMILDVADRGVESVRMRPVASMDVIRAARKVACTIHVDEKVKDYIVSLVYATREPMGYGLDLDPYLRHGASPRASLSLLAASRATAFLQGRAYVTPEDVKAMALDVLRHRVGLTYEAEAGGFDPRADHPPDPRHGHRPVTRKAT